MSLTQLRKLELNKRVDKILHAPTNTVQKNQQLEIAFILDLTSEKEYLDTTLKDAVSALKSHDKIFQNVRTNLVYWGKEKIETKVIPMTFLQMGKAFENMDEDKSGDFENETVDKVADFDKLCEYLKLFHARSKCIILITQNNHKIHKIESLNPFLKYRLLIVNPEKMITGTEILLQLIKQIQE